MAFSADSQRLATMEAQDGLTLPATVEVWDIASRKKTFELDKAGEHLSFSPDGRWIATMGVKDGAIRFWHAKSGKPAFTHQPSKKYEQGASTQFGVVLAFTPDSRFLVLGTGLLLEVHADGLKEVHTFAFPEEPASVAGIVGRTVTGRAGCLAISPDGRYLAASSWPGKVDLWDLEKRRLYRKVADCGLRRTEPSFFNNLWLAFSPDSKNLAYATDFGAVHLWNLAAGQDVLVLEDGNVREMLPGDLAQSHCHEEGGQGECLGPALPGHDPSPARPARSGPRSPQELTRPGQNEPRLCGRGPVPRSSGPGTRNTLLQSCTQP